MIITTILPVSRIKYLNRVLESLLNQTYKIENLLVIYDGTKEDFITVRNIIASLDIGTKLCVQSNNTTKAFSIPDRRRRIASIHNQAKELVGESDWVFSVEDDGVLPLNALERLVSVAEAYENVGMVTGVELGRWGVPYVGAWVVDNIDNIKVITSLDNKTSQVPFIIEQIDACGLYCGLIRSRYYKSHTFFSDNGLGPDVNLGLYLRSQGFDNYIDWGIPVTHLTGGDGFEIEIPATDKTRIVKLTRLSDNIWQASH